MLCIMHSKTTDSKFFQDPPSRIVGIGRVRGEPFIDRQNPIWIDETRANIVYTYRFYFSEMVLFTRISIDDTWDSAKLDPQKLGSTRAVILQLLNSGIWMSQINDQSGIRFPYMASMSPIENDVIRRRLIEHLSYSKFHNYRRTPPY